MAQTEFDILEYLASQRGKSAATLYAESGGKAFTEISNELTDGKGFNIIRDANGNAIGAINNSTGELLGNLTSGTTYGTAAETTASGYNIVTTATTTANETTGTITTELASGANEAATSAAGKAGATLSGVTMQTAIFSGIAALGGIAKGVMWYNDNPEFWTHLSKALFPLAYVESGEYSGDELAAAMNALIPIAVDGNGNTYLPETFMQVLADEMAGITTTETIKPNQNNWNYPSVIPTGTYSGKFYAMANPAQRITMTNVKTAIRGYKTRNGWDRGFGVIASDSETSFDVTAGHRHPDLFTYNDKTVYYLSVVNDVLSGSTDVTWTPNINYILYPNANSAKEGFNSDDAYKYLAWVLIYGEFDSLLHVEGISKQDGATYPEQGKSLQDTYPDWFENALQTLDPESTPNNPKYKYWYPVSIQNEPDSDGKTKGANTTYSQEDAQTGKNPDSKTAPDTMTVAQEKIAEALKDLTKIFTKQKIDTPTDTPTDTGETPPSIPPIISGSSNGLWAIYNPTESQLQSFGKWLWSSDIIDQIVKMISNPMDAIIGLHTIYVTPPTGGTATIKAGYLDSGVSAAKVSNQYTSIDCGTVTIPEKYQNALDYDYTRVSIYLPFIGIVPLNTRDVMGASLHLTYRVDILTGTCLAQIRVTKQNSNAVLYTYSGNCAVQIPLTSGNYGTLLTGLLSAVGGAVASVASGGAALPAVAGIGSAALNSHTNVSQSGNLGSNAGALGIRKPYVIITRPTPYNAENYPSFYGIPSQKYVMLGNVSGFTKVREIHVENINATNEEKSEIESLLKGGVIL